MRIVKKSSPENRAGAGAFAGPARGARAPGGRADPRVLRRRPRGGARAEEGAGSRQEPGEKTPRGRQNIVTCSARSLYRLEIVNTPQVHCFGCKTSVYTNYMSGMRLGTTVWKAWTHRVLIRASTPCSIRNRWLQQLCHERDTSKTRKTPSARRQP